MSFIVISLVRRWEHNLTISKSQWSWKGWYMAGSMVHVINLSFVLCFLEPPSPHSFPISVLWYTVVFDGDISTGDT